MLAVVVLWRLGADIQERSGEIKYDEGAHGFVCCSDWGERKLFYAQRAQSRPPVLPPASEYGRDAE